MSDLISREWLEDVFNNLCFHNCNICEYFRIEDSFYKCALIDTAPTVDINTKLSVAYLKGRKQGQSEERTTGKWIEISKYQVECDQCHYDDCAIKTNFCPNCGARMKRSDDEE